MTELNQTYQQRFGKALDKRREECPNKAAHTPHPTGYIAHQVWMGKMAKTHKQVRCEGCGLWTIWVPKRAKTAHNEV